MSTNDAASIFAMMFEILAENPTPSNKEVAERLFGYTKNFEFTIADMYADEALIVLELIDE